MKLSDFTANPQLLAGVTAARAAHNASLPQTVSVPSATDGEPPTEAANPALIATDEDYIVHVVLGAMRSWAQHYNGYTEPSEPVALTPEAFQAQVVSTVQLRLDAFARERGYDGILSACTYVASTVPAFAAEAQTCVNLRDATWAACYQFMADVKTGKRPMPEGVADVLAGLPVLAW